MLIFAQTPYGKACLPRPGSWASLPAPTLEVLWGARAPGPARKVGEAGAAEAAVLASLGHPGLV